MLLLYALALAATLASFALVHRQCSARDQAMVRPRSCARGAVLGRRQGWVQPVARRPVVLLSCDVLTGAEHSNPIHKPNYSTIRHVYLSLFGL